MLDLLPEERVIWSGNPTWRATIGWYAKSALGVSAVVGLLWVIGRTGWVFAWSTTGFVLLGLVLLGGAVAVDTLRRLTTIYTVTTQRLHIRRGILSRHEQSARIGRVQNVNTEQNPIQRLLRVGVVDFDTAGATAGDAEFRFEGVADPHHIASLIQPHLGGRDGLT